MKNNQIKLSFGFLLETQLIVYTNQDGQQGKTAIYARVSSYDQKEDLERQVQRLRDYCAN